MSWLDPILNVLS